MTRRAPETPLGVLDHVEAGIEDAEVLLPQELTLEVVAIEPLGAEKCDSAVLADGHGRVGVGGFGVPLDGRNPFVSVAFPLDAPRFLVEAVDLPLMDCRVVDWLDIAVETDFQRGIAAAADRRGDEHAAARDDGTGMSQSRDARFPAHAFAAGAAETRRQAKSLGDTGRLPASK
jgi:hypothetical protein